MTVAHLRAFIREALVSAGLGYTSEKEVPKQRFESELIRIAKDMATDVSRMKTGSSDHLAMIEKALNSAGITDQSLRDLVSRPFIMVPPAFLLKM